MSEAQEVWRSKSDDEVIAAAGELAEYTEEGERIIRAELGRRGLREPALPVGLCPRCGRSISTNHPVDECSQCREPLPLEILTLLEELRRASHENTANARQLDTDISALAKVLRQTQPWARFIGIVGFVSAALMIIGGVGARALGIPAESFVAYPLFGAIYLGPSMLLMRYAKRIREFVAQGEAHQLERALEAQRVFWKFVGVATLVALGMTILGFVVGLVVTIASLSRGR
jgi:hypothetical protein